jgi:hypothetical protein
LLEFSKEGSKFLICLFKAEEFRTGILYTVQVTIGAFKDLQDFGVVIELVNTVPNV